MGYKCKECQYQQEMKPFPENKCPNCGKETMFELELCPHCKLKRVRKLKDGLWECLNCGNLFNTLTAQICNWKIKA